MTAPYDAGVALQAFWSSDCCPALLGVLKSVQPTEWIEKVPLLIELIIELLCFDFFKHSDISIWKYYMLSYENLFFVFLKIFKIDRFKDFSGQLKCEQSTRSNDNKHQNTQQ